MTMKEEGGGEWNVSKEKLLCHMVLNDALAEYLSPTAGEAFWRAFIVEDRETHVISARFRWKYADKRSWYAITPKQEGITVDHQQIVETLRCGLEDVLRKAVNRFAPQAWRDDAVVCFYPPDDGGDGMRTVMWLEEKDLIEIKVFDVNRPEGEQQP